MSPLLLSALSESETYYKGLIKNGEKSEDTGKSFHEEENLEVTA